MFGIREERGENRERGDGWNGEGEEVSIRRRNLSHA